MRSGVFDERAYRILYETEHDGVVRWLVTHGVEYPDARDLTQEAFLKLWEMRGEMKDPRAYLHKTAKNLRKDYFKHIEVVNGCDEARLPKPATPPTPHELLECAEVEGVVEAALREMAPGVREVFLGYWEGTSVAEMARERGVAPATIHVQLHQARDAMEAAIQARTEG